MFTLQVSFPFDSQLRRIERIERESEEKDNPYFNHTKRTETKLRNAGNDLNIVNFLLFGVKIGLQQNADLFHYIPPTAKRGDVVKRY